jgi:hypothetical protein
MFEQIARIGRRAWLAAGVVVAMSVLGACGGGGAGAGGGGAGTSGDGGGESVRVLADSTTLNSDGKSTINLTAIVTSVAGVAMKNAQVAFAVSDPDGAGNVSVQVLNAITDATGAATAKMTLLGNPRSRDLSVVSTVGKTVSSPLIIRVTGTAVSVTGPSSLALNAGSPSSFTVTVKNSSGVPIAGQPVTATSGKGNTISPASAVTNGSGQAVFGVTGTKPDADVLTFTALGENAVANISVAGQGLAISAGSGFSDVGGVKVVPIGATATVQVAYQASGAIPGGTTVTAASTKGTVTPATQSIASGTATVGVSGTSPGPATVTAVVNGITAEFNFNFVAVTPAQVLVQSSPSTVGPNVGGATDQRTTLTATVLDASGFPVPGQLVSFNAIDDPSGGSISPGLATTDLSGRATAAFIAGPNVTAPNAVRIRASSAGIASTEALLSVSRSQLFVRLGTDNEVERLDRVALYRKTYAVVVTDATGNAVKGATVQASLRPLRYRTGQWTVVGSAWTQQITGTFDSEDVDRNGVCSATEDLNNDGQLTPGNIASIAAEVVTGDNGTAALQLQYPREFALWVDVLVEVRIQVAGSEGVASAQFWLPIAANDINSTSVAPPGQFSPLPYPTGGRDLAHLSVSREGGRGGPPHLS